MAQKKKVDLGKAEQILSKSFTDNVAELSEDEIEQLIVKAQQEVRKLKREKKNDPKLQAAKEIVSDLNGAYSSAISYSEAKSSFLLDRLEEIQNPELQD
jgi:arsenate reductase-like glutaredoxin family protein